MPTKKPQWLVTVSPEMNQKMNDLVQSESWTMNKSETIRDAIKAYLENHGIHIKNDVPKRGTYKRE